MDEPGHNTQFFGRVLGVFVWFCPECQGHNVSKLSRDNWWAVECRQNRCHAHFTFRPGLQRVRQGTRTRTPPWDTVLVGDLHPDHWRKGQPANRLIEPEKKTKRAK